MSGKSQRTKSRKPLSSGEWGVLSALWRAGRRASVNGVRSELATGADRDYRTIQTVLHRCHEKGWVKVQRDGGRCYYSAAIPRRKGVEERAAEFFSELAAGEPSALEAAQRVLERELKLLRRRDAESGRRGPGKRPRRR